MGNNSRREGSGRLVDTQSGYVTLNGAEKAASLSMDDDRLHLQVTHAEGLIGPAHPEDIELIVFRGIGMPSRCWAYSTRAASLASG